jgi:hypothetical protein
MEWTTLEMWTEDIAGRFVGLVLVPNSAKYDGILITTAFNSQAKWPAACPLKLHFIGSFFLWPRNIPASAGYLILILLRKTNFRPIFHCGFCIIYVVWNYIIVIAVNTAHFSFWNGLCIS